MNEGRLLKSLIKAINNDVEPYDYITNWVVHNADFDEKDAEKVLKNAYSLLSFIEENELAPANEPYDFVMANGARGVIDDGDNERIKKLKPGDIIIRVTPKFEVIVEVVK